MGLSPLPCYSTLNRPRVVIPEVAHHVTQRGNRRQPVFFSPSRWHQRRGPKNWDG